MEEALVYRTQSSSSNTFLAFNQSGYYSGGESGHSLGNNRGVNNVGSSLIRKPSGNCLRSNCSKGWQSQGVASAIFGGSLSGTVSHLLGRHNKQHQKSLIRSGLAGLLLSPLTWLFWGGSSTSRSQFGFGVGSLSPISPRVFGLPSRADTMMKMQQHEVGPVSRDLVLIGGGHAHAFVVKNMGMKPEPGLSVTLITPEVDTPYSGMLPGHIAGVYTREECHIDLVRLCQFGHVRLVLASATSIDLENKVVYLDDPRRPPIRYDVLSIDIGSAPQMLEGSAVASATFTATPVKPIWRFSERWQSLVDCIEAKANLVNSSSADAMNGRNQKKDGDIADGQGDGNAAALAQAQEPFTIAVVGAGAGGVELALGMQHRLEGIVQDKLKVQFVLISNKNVVCPSHNKGVQKRFARILKERGVNVIYDFEVVGLEEKRLRAKDGRIVNVDECIWCTNAKTQEWMGASGLAVDKGGFVRVKQTLESEDTPNVFAAGDCANMLEHPRPKAGVFAVRQGPPLAANLRRAIRNLNRRSSQAAEPLEEYIPQKSFLGLISTGRPYCVASRGEMSMEGKWLWKMKDYIDRKWMAGFTTDLPVMNSDLENHNNEYGHGSEADSLETLTKASLMRCGGCGAKVGKSVLDRVMQNLNPPTRPEVQVGLDAPDDCAVVQFDNTNPRAPRVVQTVDFFRSFIDDPFVFGQIAANHALSDCHAMCAEAVTAMAIAVVPFAAEPVVEGVLTQLMAGASVALEESKCALVGGHSCEGKDLALGLSVSGVVEAGDQLLTKGGVQDGDALVLTKAIGTGTIFAANMRVMAKGSWVQSAINSMLVSNKEAAITARDHDATACTDITGFGVMGHLIEMMQASDSDLIANVEVDEIPYLEGAIECVESGVFSSLQPQNTRLRRSVLNHSQAAASFPAKYPLLYDPQTSGGLLISVPAAQADGLVKALQEKGYSKSSIIGHIQRGDTEGGHRVKIT